MVDGAPPKGEADTVPKGVDADVPKGEVDTGAEETPELPKAGVPPKADVGADGVLMVEGPPNIEDCCCCVDCAAAPPKTLVCVVLPWDGAPNRDVDDAGCPNIEEDWVVAGEEKAVPPPKTEAG